MKLHYLIICILAFTACASVKESKKQSVNTIPATQKQQQPFTGVGPVNIAASNFYFKGELKKNGGDLSLYNCYTGQEIPLAKDQGIYNELNNLTNPNIAIRGFIKKVNNQNILTATYYLGEQQTGCLTSENMVGKWKCTGIDKLTLVINPDYTFALNLDKPHDKSIDIKGEWLLTSPTAIFFSYYIISPYFNHNGIFHQDRGYITVHTVDGDIIFEKSK